MTENPKTADNTKAPATTDAATDAVAEAAAPVAETPPTADAEGTAKGPEQKPGEIGGPKGPEPTRYGDWESKGRCSDF